MKKAILFSTAILAAFCFSSNAVAQNLESGFFLDNYTYTYRLNPALMPDNNFIAIGVGNVSAGIASKLGVGSFLYPGPNGHLVTGNIGASNYGGLMGCMASLTLVGINIFA